MKPLFDEKKKPRNFKVTNEAWAGLKELAKLHGFVNDRDRVNSPKGEGNISALIEAIGRGDFAIAKLPKK